MYYLPRFTAIVICFFSCLLFSQAVYSQDFSSVDSDLRALENLIADTIANTEEQQRLLDSLNENLGRSGILIGNYESTITAQENLLKDLRTQLDEMSETFRTQSALLARYERNSKFWRTITLIAVPAAAVISGGIVWAVCR
jgi:septal ring factor EnvC (AmiA/AmiB activator)